MSKANEVNSTGFVGRVLCCVNLHKWQETASPGLGLLTYYRCARCGVTGESHVADEGDIYEHEHNKELNTREPTK